MKDNEEEFTNFLQKVEQVSKIVHKLASNDSEKQNEAEKEAKVFLNGKEKGTEIFEDDLEIVQDRTQINKIVEKSPATQEKENFMAEVEKDAKKRYEDRKIRTEKMETFKKRAFQQFSRGEFENSLNNYNKAIELIKDDHNLYIKRAITYEKLGFYSRSLEDLNTALKLNEKSYKARVIKCKIFCSLEKFDEMNALLSDLKTEFPQKISEIEDYQREFIREI